MGTKSCQIKVPRYVFYYMLHIKYLFYMFLPSLEAIAFTCSDPKTDIISARPVTSSGALKKGYVRLKRHRRITPTAHMSTARKDFKISTMFIHNIKSYAYLMLQCKDTCTIIVKNLDISAFDISINY